MKELLDLPPACAPLPDGGWQCTGQVHYHGKKVSDPETRAKLAALARKLGRDLHLTSGDRTPEDQERLDRAGYRPARNSQHLHGKAADLWVEGIAPQEVAPLARAVGFTGIGIYERHLHVDTREVPVTWCGSPELLAAAEPES